MKLVLGEINGVWLQDLMQKTPESCTRVTAAVAYATGNSPFFDHCLQNNRFLEFYGLLDEDQAVGIAVMRHTFATWHREAGTPTHELQRLGGWKTQSMVERYAHVAPEGLQFAANRLDSLMQGRDVSQSIYALGRLAK